MSGQPEPEDVAPPGRWGAFSYPNYRRFWVATVARVFGLQFRFIGVGWFVVSRDGLDLSPIWIGIVGLASALPNIVLTVPAGVITDRDLFAIVAARGGIMERCSRARLQKSGFRRMKMEDRFSTSSKKQTTRIQSRS